MMDTTQRANLRRAIRNHLNCTLTVQNAVLLAETLVASHVAHPAGEIAGRTSFSQSLPGGDEDERGDDNPRLHLNDDLFLLATCRERAGNPKGALDALSRMTNQFESAEATYLTAWCLFSLGSYMDAQRCLLSFSSSSTTRGENDVPNGAAGLFLLGKIAQRSGAYEEASKRYRACLALEPYLFEAVTNLATCNAQIALASPALRRDIEDDDKLEDDDDDRENVSHALIGNKAPLLTTNPTLRALERASYALARLDCRECLRVLNEELPPSQRASATALCLLGRAHFELGEYAESCTAFQKLRAIEPSRTNGLEIYSTALWHLKRQVELAHLARETVERDPRSPVSWCIVGNCFSLEKEHDLAIRFFRRAVQLDENFTYAYTLAGHEYVANEDFERAVTCYRHALRTDPHHYNAWWGLGTIYFRQEKYDLAEIHFRRAITIHPSSSVLWCFLGMLLHSAGRNEAALEALDAAAKLHALNPQARFQRAQVLWSMGRGREALGELEKVRDAVPKEPSVYLLMGKICRALNLRERAMICFVAALDLEKDGSSVVREAIDQLIEESHRSENNVNDTNNSSSSVIAAEEGDNAMMMMMMTEGRRGEDGEDEDLGGLSTAGERRRHSSMGGGPVRFSTGAFDE